MGGPGRAGGSWLVGWFVGSSVWFGLVRLG